jgi:hypothetical protein
LIAVEGDMTVKELQKRIYERYPESQLHPLTQDDIHIFETESGSILPDDLRELFTTIGYGTIGRSSYSIHFMTAAREIFGDAESLQRKFIVGDDFAGSCEVYDSGNNWAFGSMTNSSDFSSIEEIGSFADFLEYFLLSDS